MSNLKAIILAAGEGTRLRPLTNNKPKAMVELFGMTLLERQIEIFKNCGINDVIVVTGYKDEMINFSNIKKLKNFDYHSTNMVETLFCAKDELAETVIVSYGDIIFEKNVLFKLLNSDDDIAVVVDKNWKRYWEERFDEPLTDAESLKLDSMNNILEIGQKVNHLNEIEGQYIGLIKFKGESLNFIKKFYEETKQESKISGKNPLNPNLPFRKSYMTDFIEGLINKGLKVKAVPINGGWLELDNINDFELYNKLYQEKKLSDFIKIGN